MKQGMLLERFEGLSSSNKEKALSQIVDVEHTIWKRACNRCGFVKKTEYEPQEVIDEREELERKEKIKKLERELKILKNPKN